MEGRNTVTGLIGQLLGVTIEMRVEDLIYLELDYILADLVDNPRYIITLVDPILNMGIPL